MMDTQDREGTTLSRKDLQAYPRPVADVLLEAVNTYGVPYRTIDGRHLRLYNGDRAVTPFKVSASRPAERALPYLHDWLDTNWKPWADREQVTAESLSALQARFSDDPATEEETDAPESEPVEETATTWAPLLNPRDEDTGFVTDGETVKCTVCGWSRPKSDGNRGLHLHMDRHEGGGIRERSTRTRAAHRDRRKDEKEQRKTYVDAALAALAEHHGFVLSPASEGDPAKENERLRTENERLRTELDETKARLALVKEAMKA